MKTSVLAAIVAAIVGSSADATVYLVNLTLKNVAVQGSITTDGTIGTINANNILSYTFSFKNVSWTGTSDTIDQRSMSLIATATDLEANFQKTTTYQWFDFDSPDQTASFCVQGSNCYNTSGPGLGVFLDDTSTIYAGPKMSGIQSFAHVAANVPEPASWSMLIGGLGLIGVTMRRTKTVSATA